MLKQISRTIAVTALAGAAAVSFQQAGMAASAATLRAYGVEVSALGLTLAQVPVATSASPSVSLPSIGVGSLLAAGALNVNVSTDPGSGTETATAQVAGLEASFLGATQTVGAISATCHALPGQTPTGNATITNGVLRGLLGVPTINLATNPAVNTSYGLPGIATITANEHISNPDGSLTVNALHIRLVGGLGGDIIVSSATCGPAAVPAPMVSPAGALLAGGLGLAAFAGTAGVRRFRRGRTIAV